MCIEQFPQYLPGVLCMVICGFPGMNTTFNWTHEG
jgi:hypothetical protein